MIKTPHHQIPDSEQIQNLKSLAGSIAHETRNPLASIQGCCDVIKENLEQALEFIDLISISSNRGLSVIDLILHNIKDEKFDESKFVNLSMSKVIYKALKEYAFKNDEEKCLIYLNLRKNFHFKGDETLMIYVLFNLIKNSLYNKARIDISLKKGTNFNYLYFKDNGMGIPKANLENIFENFFTSNKKGGTGLGLPFCKRVMEAFGGDISCKSKEYEGVEFCLKFKSTNI